MSTPVTTLLALVTLILAGTGCDDATDLGGPAMNPKDVVPQSQEQAQNTLLGYVTKTLQALPPGYSVDASRFGGTGSGNVGCDDDATSPDAPTRFSAAGDLTVPPDTDFATIPAAFGSVWRSWGWHVHEADGFRKPNQFGVSPDGYRLKIVAAAIAGYPPGFEASSPCFPGTLARDDVSFPVVVNGS